VRNTHSDPHSNTHCESYPDAHSDSDAHAHPYCYCYSYAFAYTNSYRYLHSYAYSDAYSQPNTDCYAYADPDANPMYRKMLTNTQAQSNFVRATHSATSPHTAAYCFAERDPCTTTYSASSSDTAADVYRVAASYSGAAPVAFARER
jgi:hypothetical protein